jgi:lysozyme family protein
MSSPNFDKVIGPLLVAEGGYVNNPDDPGGETNLGITWPVLKQAISLNLLPDTTTIKSLTVDQAKIIYEELFWKPIKGDTLPITMALYVFDSAVNQGISPAIKMLQRALDVAQDGLMGQATMSAVSKIRPWHTDRFMAYRAMRYQSTKNFDRFGEGWLIRLFETTRKGVNI